MAGRPPRRPLRQHRKSGDAMPCSSPRHRPRAAARRSRWGETSRSSSGSRCGRAPRAPLCHRHVPAVSSSLARSRNCGQRDRRKLVLLASIRMCFPGLRPVPCWSLPQHDVQLAARPQSGCSSSRRTGMGGMFAHRRSVSLTKVHAVLAGDHLADVPVPRRRPCDPHLVAYHDPLKHVTPSGNGQHAEARGADGALDLAVVVFGCPSTGGHVVDQFQTARAPLASDAGPIGSNRVSPSPFFFCPLPLVFVKVACAAFRVLTLPIVLCSALYW